MYINVYNEKIRKMIHTVENFQCKDTKNIENERKTKQGSSRKPKPMPCHKQASGFKNSHAYCISFHISIMKFLQNQKIIIYFIFLVNRFPGKCIDQKQQLLNQDYYSLLSTYAPSDLSIAKLSRIMVLLGAPKPPVLLTKKTYSIIFKFKFIMLNNFFLSKSYGTHKFSIFRVLQVFVLDFIRLLQNNNKIMNVYA
jgi:hypothetical protein